jgi:uncharacterized protein YbdZ (MbtH family)
MVAVDVPRGWTIAFDLTKGSEKIKVTAPAAGSGYYTATGTATLLVSDGNTQTITAPLLLKTDAYVPPPAPDIEFDQPGAFTPGETKFIPLDVITSTVRSITPVDVPRGWEVVYRGDIIVTAPADDGKYYTASGTVKLLVSDDAERTIIKPLNLSCPAYQAPEKLGIDFTQPCLFVSNDYREIGFTTTGDVVAVKVLDIPAGWTITVTRSDNAGAFNVTAPNENTPALEALVLVSDAAGNVVMRTLELRVVAPLTVTPPAALNGGDRTLSINNQDIAAMDYVAPAVITGGTLTGAPAGVSGSFTGNSYTVYGKPVVGSTAVFTYTVSLDVSGYCTVGTATGVLEVERCTNCAVWTKCGFKYITNKDTEGDMKWSPAVNACKNKGAGWLMASLDQSQCMCNNKNTLPGGVRTDDRYWTSNHSSSSDSCYGTSIWLDDCYTQTGSSCTERFFKCVK